MANLSDYFQESPGKYYRGYPDVTSRKLLDIEFPNGVGINPWQPSNEDCLVVAPGVTVSGTAQAELGSGGVLFVNAAQNEFSAIMQVSGLPDLSTGTRVYEFSGKTGRSLVSEDGIRLLFNYLDIQNHWELRLYWTGSSPRLYFGERVANVFNFRGTAITLSGANSVAAGDIPQWYVRLVDNGDVVRAAAYVFGHSTLASDTASVSGDTVYYAANRPLKAYQTVLLTGGGGVPDTFRVANFIISERIY